MLKEKPFIENYSLKHHNTFGVDVTCSYFAFPTSLHALKDIMNSEFAEDSKVLILGGGSNVLFTGDFNGLVIHPALKGINIISETDDFIELEVSAGENWNDFVEYCVDRGLGGLENLILIPGNVGAAPIQNIGAYGVEQKDFFAGLKALEVETGLIKDFNSAECLFAYRDSIFKKEKGKFVIVSVLYRLQKNPKVNVKYAVLKEYLEKSGVSQPGIKDVANAVKTIRRSKLPDHEILGNAGSFFKNKVVDEEQFNKLVKDFPGIPFYELPGKKFKIPSAWLIEKCGWKGKRSGNAGVHAKQALVLVNYGGATGREILELAEMITDSVNQRFNILLEKEVNIL